MRVKVVHKEGKFGGDDVIVAGLSVDGRITWPSRAHGTKLTKDGEGRTVLYSPLLMSQALMMAWMLGENE